MTRRLSSAALAAGLVLGLSTQVLAQPDTSRQQIPFLTGEAAALAAKMLAICGGASGQSRVTFTVKQAPPATPLTVTVGGIPQATVVPSSAGSARLVFETTPTGTAQPLDFGANDVTITLLDGGVPLVSRALVAGRSPATRPAPRGATATRRA